ncbi:MAG: hypothetical protein LBK95_19075 [Bifidobacteriaceae bacterium]|nr:hypothetical protein [Bifidobacteriaceae bacterium]
MRRTTDLLPATDRRVKRLALTSDRSISVTIADLVARGLDTLPSDDPETDPRTGLPVFSFGKTLTVQEIDKLIQED